MGWYAEPYYVGRAEAPPIWVLGFTKCRWDSTLPIPLKSRPPLVRDACTRLIIVLHDSSTVAAPWHPKHDPDEANARKPDKSRKVTPKCERLARRHPEGAVLFGGRGDTAGAKRQNDREQRQRMQETKDDDPEEHFAECDEDGTACNQACGREQRGEASVGNGTSGVPDCVRCPLVAGAGRVFKAVAHVGAKVDRETARHNHADNR